MFGYCGWLLEVDLTLAKTKKIPLTEELTKKYIGGSGIGAALYVEYTKDKNFQVEPLSSDNPLIFMTGPMTGSTISGSARMEACSRSPLTNIWAQANTGGFWGPELKKAGFDGVIIKGKASNPVTLCIEDGKAELFPAGDLWGKDIYTTIDELSERGRVLTIGQAGENQLTMAGIAVTKHNFLGRCGLGAVMGSKKLKAIVAKGSKKYAPASPEKMKELSRSIIKKAKANPMLNFLGNMGTIGGIEGGLQHGDICIKNWQVGPGGWDDIVNIFGSTVFKEKYGDGSKTCHACSIACKQQLDTTNTTKYKVKGATPEYESASAFGTSLLNDDATSVAKCNELCNRYGLDTISTGTTIAVAIECFEKGYITTKDTNGLELKWGDGDMAVELVNQIGQNKGFGARLAKGSQAFVADLDSAATEILTTVKGLESPFHEPRLFWGLGLDYATGNRGACHVSSCVYMVEAGVQVLPQLYGEEKFVPPSKDGKAKMVKKAQDFSSVFHSAAAYCQFGGLPVSEDDLVEAMNAATGYNLTFDDIMQIGERIWCLKRTLGNIWGIRKADDRLPKRFLTPLKEGPIAGVVPAIDEMVEEYYQERGLDENGFLRQDVLKRCELPQEVINTVTAVKQTAAGDNLQD